MAFRIDRGSLRSPQKTATGLRVDAYITRVGVFKYHNADGTERLELREPNEVFHTDSLASFCMIPVTDDHPPIALDSSNATNYARGAVGENVTQINDMVAAGLTIYDARLIAKMEAGKSQVSCGYTCDIEFAPGDHPQYGRYDAVQRNIRGNHVAIVDLGRAGPEVRVRLDAAEMIPAAPQDKKQMDELQKQLAAALRDAAEQRARADTAEVKLADATSRIDVADALALSEKARADSADRIRADAAAGFATAVNARVILVTSATKVLKTDVSALTDRDIKIAMVKSIDNIVVDETRSDEFVEALYTSALTRIDAASQAMGQLRAVIQDNRQNDVGPDTEAAAQRKMIERNAALSRTQGA